MKAKKKPRSNRVASNDGLGRAVRREREACARECDGWARAVERVGKYKEQAFAYRNAAYAIRQRSNEKLNGGPSGPSG